MRRVSLTKNFIKRCYNHKLLIVSALGRAARRKPLTVRHLREKDFISKKKLVINHESVILVLMKREKWLRQLRLRDEVSKIRKEKWEALKACERVSWETWKRLVANFGIEKAKEKAKKIVDKQGKKD